MARQPFMNNQRREVAQVAARLMLEQGMDFLPAKKKAAQQLGLQDHAALPSNQEVEQALLENQRLFFDGEVRSALREMRMVAVQAMSLFEEYRPRLVGDAVSGALTAASEIELHVFCDHVEQVSVALIDAEIDYRLMERRLRWRADEQVNVPVYAVVLDDIEVFVYVFDHNGERQSPLSPVDGRPMVRKSRAELDELMTGDQGDSLVDRFFG